MCALQNKQIYIYLFIYFLIMYLIHIFFMYILISMLISISISSISGDTNFILASFRLVFCWLFPLRRLPCGFHLDRQSNNAPNRRQTAACSTLKTFNGLLSGEVADELPRCSVVRVVLWGPWHLFKNTFFKIE